MRCLYCGEKIPLLKRFGQNRFCSPAHEAQFKLENAKLGLERLLDARTNLQAHSKPPQVEKVDKNPKPVAAPQSPAPPVAAAQAAEPLPPLAAEPVPVAGASTVRLHPALASFAYRADWVSPMGTREPSLVAKVLEPVNWRLATYIVEPRTRRSSGWLKPAGRVPCMIGPRAWRGSLPGLAGATAQKPSPAYPSVSRVAARVGIAWKPSAGTLLRILAPPAKGVQGSSQACERMATEPEVRQPDGGLRTRFDGRAALEDLGTPGQAGLRRIDGPTIKSPIWRGMTRLEWFGVQAATSASGAADSLSRQAHSRLQVVPFFPGPLDRVQPPLAEKLGRLAGPSASTMAVAVRDASAAPATVAPAIALPVGMAAAVRTRQLAPTRLAAVACRAAAGRTVNDAGLTPALAGAAPGCVPRFDAQPHFEMAMAGLVPMPAAAGYKRVRADETRLAPLTQEAPEPHFPESRPGWDGTVDLGRTFPLSAAPVRPAGSAAAEPLPFLVSAIRSGAVVGIAAQRGFALGRLLSIAMPDTLFPAEQLRDLSLESTAAAPWLPRCRTSLTGVFAPIGSPLGARTRLTPLLQIWRKAPAEFRWAAIAIPVVAVLWSQADFKKLSTTPASPPVAQTGAAQPGIARNVSTENFWDQSLKSLRQTIRERAAVGFQDDFRSGLSNWDGAPEWSRTWSYDPAGFVRVGQLALFQPTIPLTDYRLAFSGTIEKKALSWALRAQDLRNYYAFKIVITKPGPLPFASLMRYAVIQGHEEKPVLMPLPISVRNDTIYDVRVDVNGSEYTTFVQGQIVDSWSDGRLKSGGVGFFSVKGEQSRLNGVAVSHQYDTLGRLCAYLAPGGIQNQQGSLKQ